MRFSEYPPEPARKTTPNEMDALLDKIAQSGIESLTAKEKARLEAGREELLKRGRR